MTESLKPNTLETPPKLGKQILLFLVVGVGTILVAFSLIVLQVEVFKMEKNLANFFSNLVATYVAYLLNIKYVFVPGKVSFSAELSFFYIFAFIGLGLNSGIFYLVSKFFPELNYVLVKFLAVLGVAVFNFVTRKFIIFKG